MEHGLKITLQVLFLFVLAWALAAMLGYAQGFSVNVGGKGKKGCGGKGTWQPGQRDNPYRWKATGMVGQLSPSIGHGQTWVGQSQLIF